MAQQTINVGTAPNDGTGTPLRTAFQYTNSNFSELYTALGGGSGLPGAANQIIFNNGSSLAGNANLTFNTALNKLVANNIETAANLLVGTSATITGDLTVRTNKLAVTSTGVGAGTATPLYPLHLVGEFGLEEASPAGTGSKLRFIGDATKYNFRIGKQLNVSNGFEITPSTTVGGTTFSNPVYTVSYDGIHTFLDGAGGTRMTLNATGLGVGEAASVARLQPRGSTSDSSAYVIYAKNSGGSVINFMRNDGRFLVGNGTTDNFIVTETGNVGIGVTPSAWASNRKALQVGGLAAAALALNGTSNVSEMFFNSFINTSASNVYAVNGRAGFIDFGSGGFGFSIDSGTQTAGAACNFTRAMTLDASGNLLVGTTSSNGSISNASYVIGGIFSTLNGILSSVATATPTTLFAAPSESTLMVTASVNGASPSDYKVVAVVKRGGAAVAITTISSATSITITASGTNIQVTQTSGGTQNVYFNVIRLA